jgi:hypothetical protein
MSLRQLVAVSIFTLAVGGFPAAADPITYDFTGVANGNNFVGPGTTVTGSFTYDPSVAASPGSTSSLAFFLALLNFNYSISGFESFTYNRPPSLDLPQFMIEQTKDFMNIVAENGTPQAYLILPFSTPIADATVLQTPSLNPGGRIDIFSLQFDIVIAPLTSLSPVPTPIVGAGLPGLISVLGGAGLIGWFRRRRQIA